MQLEDENEKSHREKKRLRNKCIASNIVCH